MDDKKIEEDFESLTFQIRSQGASDDDLKRLNRAWEFTKLAHAGQKRKSGEPFISHPLAVAAILADWKLDCDSIIAALLHDTVEDGGARKEDIVSEFGAEIARLVNGLTNVSNVKLKGSREEEFIENLRKMFLSMTKDLRIVVIKLADKLHNLQTISALPEERQIKFSNEILTVFAPLADRLEMGGLKTQLEDLAFEVLYPQDFEKVRKLSLPVYRHSEERIKLMKKSILKELSEEKVSANITGRRKHLYSLWRKLCRPGIDWDFNKVYDIVALRIIVDTVADCYTALGVVHSVFKPVPNLDISDFIAQPKPNGYQSIHTRVFYKDRHVVEVQIRTQKMHEEAERGIAAHWVYAEAKSKGAKEDVLEERGIEVSEKLAWVQQLAEWQDEIKDSKEFMKAVKFDALSQRIYVFSPKGDVYDLPAGATPVDFAYGVHTDLGEYIKSAKLNGKIVSLDTKLDNGDVVEIIKNKKAKPPSRDWLRFVVSTNAKRNIIKQLK